MRQLSDHLKGQTLLRGPFDAGLVGEIFDLAKSNVFFGEQLIAHVILEDHADLFAEVFHAVLAQVHAVQQDLPGGRIVEPRQ